MSSKTRLYVPVCPQELSANLSKDPVLTSKKMDNKGIQLQFSESVYFKMEINEEKTPKNYSLILKISKANDEDVLEANLDRSFNVENDTERTLCFEFGVLDFLNENPLDIYMIIGLMIETYLNQTGSPEIEFKLPETEEDFEEDGVQILVKVGKFRTGGEIPFSELFSFLDEDSQEEILESYPGIESLVER